MRVRVEGVEGPLLDGFKVGVIEVRDKEGSDFDLNGKAVNKSPNDGKFSSELQLKGIIKKGLVSRLKMIRSLT